MNAILTWGDESHIQVGQFLGPPAITVNGTAHVKVQFVEKLGWVTLYVRATDLRAFIEELESSTHRLRNLEKKHSEEVRDG